MSIRWKEVPQRLAALCVEKGEEDYNLSLVKESEVSIQVQEHGEEYQGAAE